MSLKEAVPSQKALFDTVYGRYDVHNGTEFLLSIKPVSTISAEIPFWL